MRKSIGRWIHQLQALALTTWFKLTEPPRLLRYHSRVNIALLRAFGATVGDNVTVLAPLILHLHQQGFGGLTIKSDCILNGNNFLDLAGRITLAEGVSLGPNVCIMTHNAYHANPWLERQLAHTVGVGDVAVRAGASIKAGALITHGVTIGADSVVGGGAVVNTDIAGRTLVAGNRERLVVAIE